MQTRKALALWAVAACTPAVSSQRKALIAQGPLVEYAGVQFVAVRDLDSGAIEIEIDDLDRGPLGVVDIGTNELVIHPFDHDPWVVRSSGPIADTIGVAPADWVPDPILCTADLGYWLAVQAAQVLADRGLAVEAGPPPPPPPPVGRRPLGRPTPRPPTHPTPPAPPPA